MITPGDITDELIERANGEIRANCGPNPPTDHERVAAILNAAIDAGLVSPPVWAVICKTSQGEFIADMLPTQFEADEKLQWRKDRVSHVKYRAEHWRGQVK